MPARVRPCEGILPRSTPLNSTEPRRGGNRPMMLRIRLVFPAPLRPISPAMMPLGSSMVTSRRTVTAWIAASRPEILSTRDVLRFRAHRHLPSDHVLAHISVAKHVSRSTIRQNASFVESDDPLGVPADDLHVVLDEEHGH